VALVSFRKRRPVGSRPSHGWARFWDYARKAGIGLLGCLATLAASHLLPDPWDKYGPAIIAIATYFGVYGVQNIDPRSKQELPSGSDPSVR
jgi:hypothetical protein